MNILAHIFLSENIDDLMIGNFMGDFVKGSDYKKYPKEIEKGILLHRRIDDLADKHPHHKKTRDKFRDNYGLHSGIIVDIIYDHFLATAWDSYHHIPLETFSSIAYSHIEKNLHSFPDKLKLMVPYMINSNWLVLYKTNEGLKRVFNGMSTRTSLPNHSDYAIKILNNNYSEIYSEFKLVMNDLIEMSSNYIKNT